MRVTEAASKRLKRAILSNKSAKKSAFCPSTYDPTFVGPNSGDREVRFLHNGTSVEQSRWSIQYKCIVQEPTHCDLNSRF